MSGELESIENAIEFQALQVEARLSFKDNQGVQRYVKCVESLLAHPPVEPGAERRLAASKAMFDKAVARYSAAHPYPIPRGAEVVAIFDGNVTIAGGDGEILLGTKVEYVHQFASIEAVTWGTQVKVTFPNGETHIIEKKAGVNAPVVERPCARCGAIHSSDLIVMTNSGERCPSCRRI